MIKSGEQSDIKLILKTVGLTAFQFLIFIAAYKTFYQLHINSVGQIRRDIQFGLQLHYGIYLLAFLALINSAAKIFAKKKTSYLVTVTCGILWGIFWSNIYSSMPYRSIAVLSAGIASLISVNLLLFKNKSQATVLK